jgi:hypothetical protein
MGRREGPKGDRSFGTGCGILAGLADKGVPNMSLVRTRLIGVFVVAGALAFATGSTAVALPTAQPAKSNPCTYKILPKTAAKTLTVKTASANIRKLPGVGCQLLKTVPKGTKLKGTGGNARVGTSPWQQTTAGWIASSQVQSSK